MAYLVKHSHAPWLTQSWPEHCYQECVRIVNGYGLVEHPHSLPFLNKSGFDLVREIPGKPEDLARTAPAEALELAEMGLGPLAGASRYRLNKLKKELEEGGRLAEFAVTPDPGAAMWAGD